MLKYLDTHVLEILDPVSQDFGVKILVKLENLNHPLISGNKWWKLKYNLEQAKRDEQKTLLTFGGAFSNHIFATAAAASEMGFESIGIIRGEEILPLNRVLKFAKTQGMKLEFISREAYRKKNENAFIEYLREKYGRFFLIPEGGTNALAVKGCAEFAREKLSSVEFDYLCLPVGTGGTMAGIICGLEGNKEIIGFQVLKGAEFLMEEINSLAKDFSGRIFSNWNLEMDYHFGGYAKRTKELDDFITKIDRQHNIKLDPIYTGKMVAGVFDLINRNRFSKGTTILLVHTGGLNTI